MRLKILAIFILCIPGFVILSAQKSASKFVLSGVVLDVNNKPVQGAMIFIDSKRTEYVTDGNGYYKLKVSSKAKTISVFTLTGLVTEEPINGRTVINFMIKRSAESSNTGAQTRKVEEETINVGYGTSTKGNLTTTVSKIDGENPKYASYNSIYDMIRGEVPGVQVSGTTITIQGPTSINLSSAPLLVVDGIVVGTIDDIRPQQVKSIEILKGSAASIYGSRGANGVILISLIGGQQKK